MEYIFSYGTLQKKKVQEKTFGRKLNGVEDVLVGYIISNITIEDSGVIETSGTNTHPILKFTGNKKDQVKGTVFKITRQELALADKYEVKEYKRVSILLNSGTVAWVYIENI